LKGAWFQPLSDEVKTGFKVCSFKCNLCRYNAASTGKSSTLSLGSGVTEDQF
jgi:hypothetical protein